jgi:outer membrane protein TolC
MIALAALLGLPESALPEQIELASLAPPSPVQLADPQVGELVEIAFRLRPDLQQSEWSVEQAAANVKVARAEYYPTISLLASLDGERPDDPSFETDDFGNSVGISISYNIFAGGLYRAQYQRAKASLYEAEKIKETVRIDASSAVRTAVTRLRSTQKQLPLQRASAELVQRNRDLVEKEYKAGVGSLVRLNEAQRDLVTAQVRLAIARVSLHQAWYELQSATGEILTIFRP